ncbi:hypothetical protein GWK16_23870 [Roseomonas sp. JC162]|uniref:Uncharacterized protein n=1 Tax=Neoroseomonas marina TaxID=1232220 RepID=A0A848EK36_9PROT|nr:hypothetical protein [Neoroseomonas marina]NMJ44306.1 hypothetical protein [Neoroseomonas marina]
MALASDGWWSRHPADHVAAARRWVRWRLLSDPHMTDAACDRFIASLDEDKRGDLVRRAVEGHSPAGF